MRNVNWSQLTAALSFVFKYLKIHLDENKISAKGTASLKKGNWLNLTLFYLAGNQIEDQGCRHLIQAKWPNL